MNLSSSLCARVVCNVSAPATPSPLWLQPQQDVTQVGLGTTMAVQQNKQTKAIVLHYS